MSCNGYKGGIGTASRRVELPEVTCDAGALVLANFGRPDELVIDGVRVGEALGGASTVAEPARSGGLGHGRPGE